MDRIVLLPALALVLGCQPPACGPGTRLDGTTCVVDPSDAAARDASVDAIDPPDAPTTIAPGSVLDIEPGSVRVTLGLMACVALEVLAPDGSRSAVPSSAIVTLEPDESHVALVDEECGTGRIGLVGIGVDTTLVTVVVTEGDQQIRAGMDVAVNATAVHFAAPTLVGSGALGVGGSASVDWLSTPAHHRIDGVNAGAADGQPRLGWWSVVSSDPAVLAVDNSEPGVAALNAASVGTAALRVRYDAPVGEFSSDIREVRVVDGGTLELPVAIAFVDSAGGTISEPLDEPAISFFAELIGRYRTDDAEYIAPIPDGVTWTARGTVTRVGSNAFRTGADGPGVIVGCHGGRCVTAHLCSPWTTPHATRIRVLDPGPIPTVSSNRLCLPVRAEAVLEDGSVVDFTDEAELFTQFTFTHPAGFEETLHLDRAVGADGSPDNNESSDPCFVMGVGNRPVDTTVTVRTTTRTCGSWRNAEVAVSF